ncbi:hypothetical protein IGK56_002804 [Enterococcus sp. AZ152]
MKSFNCYLEICKNIIRYFLGIVFYLYFFIGSLLKLYDCINYVVFYSHYDFLYRFILLLLLILLFLGVIFVYYSVVKFILPKET